MIKVKDLKKGMHVYECEYGINLGATILEDAQRINEPMHNGWLAKAKSDDGVEFEFFHTGECDGPYAPKIYEQKQYLSRKEIDEIVKGGKVEA